MTNAEFLNFIEEFITLKKLSPTAFGMKYAGDPNFVFDLRKGREVREYKKEKMLQDMGER